MPGTACRSVASPRRSSLSCSNTSAARALPVADLFEELLGLFFVVGVVGELDRLREGALQRGAREIDLPERDVGFPELEMMGYHIGIERDRFFEAVDRSVQIAFGDRAPKERRSEHPAR